jgi:hypothetical protein
MVWPRTGNGAFCAVLYGIASTDEEILTLLLEILGWRVMVAESLTVESVQQVHLLFCGMERPTIEHGVAAAVAGTLVHVFSADQSSRVEVDTDAVGAALFSPIDLQAAEELINRTAADVMSSQADQVFRGQG